MKIETVAVLEAEMECSREEWQRIDSQIRDGDELVRYANTVARLNFCSGEEGIALLRNGEFVMKIVTAIVG